MCAFAGRPRYPPAAECHSTDYMAHPMRDTHMCFVQILRHTNTEKRQHCGQPVLTCVNRPKVERPNDVDGVVVQVDAITLSSKGH